MSDSLPNVNAAPAKPIALRAHHLLCMLTFVGEGYAPAFIANLHAIVARIGAGSAITLVAGPDDICAGLGSDTQAEHCERASVAARDAAARTSLAALGPTALEPLLTHGEPIVVDDALVATLRAAFADGRLRSPCTGCAWSPLCNAVASRDFRGTVL